MVAPELVGVLVKPLVLKNRCEASNGECCPWQPEIGHIPRGYCGATGLLSDVRLVIVNAEPGDEGDQESYTGGPSEMCKQAAEFAEEKLWGGGVRREGRPAPFHNNLRRILLLCWQNASRHEIMRETWITNSVLCSAKKSGGTIDRVQEDACLVHLSEQLSLLPTAYVIALGGKAQRRLRRLGRLYDPAHHPSARSKLARESTWCRVARNFRRWMEATA